MAIIEDWGFGTGHFGKELYSGLVADTNETLLGNTSYRISLQHMVQRGSPEPTQGRGVPMLRAFRDTATVKNLRFLLKQANADIAHVNIVNSRYPRPIAKAIREQGVALVMTVHNYGCLCPTGWATRLPELRPCEDLGAQIHCPLCLWKGARESPHQNVRALLDGFNQYNAFRFLARDSDSVIVPSKTLAARIQNEMSLPRLHAVYNPVPAELLESEPCLGEEDTVLFAGRLTYEKGVYMLPSLADIMKPTKLHVIGKGPLAGFIERQARTRPNLVFHGYVSHAEKTEIFRRARAIIIPSLWFEAFGYSAAEALALGKPIVGFNVGGIGELISESGGGRAIKPFDIKEFSEAVESIVGSRKTSAELGIRGKEFAQNELSEASFALKLGKVYAESMNRRR